jgi:hypothetical protein
MCRLSAFSTCGTVAADVYCGCDHAIIERRRKIKQLTIRKRGLDHQ